MTERKDRIKGSKGEGGRKREGGRERMKEIANERSVNIIVILRK